MLEVKGGNWKSVGAPDFTRLHLGYPAGGAQDRFSYRALNTLLGNAAGAISLEFTLVPPAVTFLKPAHFAVGGAPCDLQIAGHSAPRWTVLRAAAGDRLDIRLGGTGCRVYLAIAGGLDESLNFAGDALGSDEGHSSSPSQDWAPPLGELRIVPGPEFNESIEQPIKDYRWIVSPTSNGMGVRLTADSDNNGLSLPSYDITSSPVQDGTIQATPDGLIALLRDRGTLGGYPRVAQVIDPDVDRLAQLRPGDPVRLKFVSEEEARAVAMRRADS